MKRKIGVLFGFALVAALFTVLAFINNLVAIVNWWRGFLAAGGDSSGFSAKAPGFIPWLDWTAVDYSAVTTFIPALGCTCLAVALFRLLRGRRLPAADFPFFRGSDQLNVALGLFGTLWGIIVIGYFKLDTVSMADLMQCLHTALFSTLTAVVWVFMIDRPLLRPYFARLLAATDQAEADEGDLASAVERLVSRLDAASDAFEARQKAADEAFQRRQDQYEKSFDDRLKTYEAAAQKRQMAYEGSFETRLKETAEAQAKRQADYETAFNTRQKAADASFEKRLADYQAAFDARQKEYTEFFTRRIAELEKQAAEERARADRMSEKLIAVSEALR